MSNRKPFGTYTIPLVLLALCAISYGVLVPWLGWYWDDWPSIWFLRVMGAAGFTDVFTIDRPTLGYLFWLTTAILGESLLAWQVFGFISRWLSCLAFWWFLNQIWQNKPEPVAWASILFTIYPGFYQQYIPITYSHMYLILALVLFSLGMIVKGLKSQAKFWLYYTISFLSALYSTFTLEYFFGLELIRPVIIWISLKETYTKFSEKLKKVIQLCLPFWGMITVFLYWRFFIHPTPRGHVQFQTDTIPNIFNEIRMLVTTALQDIFQSSVLAWVQTFNLSKLYKFGLAPTLAYGLLVLAVSISVIYFLYKYHQKVPSEILSHQKFYREAIFLGVIAIFTAGWPFWMTKLPIELDFPWDRFTLAFMAGVSLLFTGIIGLLPVHRTLKICLLGVLVGAAVGTHFRTANDYRREWNSEKDFFWQIAWRAPQIKPGTALLISELPFEYSTDNSLTAPLNMMYAPHNTTTTMSYLLVSIESRLDTFLTSLEKGIEINQLYRSFTFRGSTSQAIVLYYTPPGCVKFLDPSLDARLPQKPKYLAEAMRLSDLNLIDPNPLNPVEMDISIFGEEPEPNWCYYYEKADLARQTGDWQTTTDLGEKAFALNTRLYETNAPELLPFIEANAHLGKWENAIKYSQKAYALSFRMNRILCETWKRIATQTPSTTHQNNAVQQMMAEFKCQ
ncbi:MAG: hypothetical protein JW908_01020 [Anaerolineales bacterium]|nr:hypothetical protein [Anaerolineales bacterium]